MPEIIINGPSGRLEARYHHAGRIDSPIALILHPHPQFGGTMNNPIVYNMYYAFTERGFSVLRFNFRGVGRSQGYFDNGPGELADAASALDWVQLQNPDSRSCWQQPRSALSRAKPQGGHSILSARGTTPRRPRPIAASWRLTPPMHRRCSGSSERSSR
jgi:hypothetical protein